MPGLFFQAAAELGIDMHRSIMIGDAVSDMEAGRAAGVQRNLLVRTGRGEKQAAEALKKGNLPDAVYSNLMEALQNEINSKFSR
jgi:D-glycero-D-manno-heptose 1,7-bisphosphate phosphatase